jgi:hypothetical protein
MHGRWLRRLHAIGRSEAKREGVVVLASLASLPAQMVNGVVGPWEVEVLGGGEEEGEAQCYGGSGCGYRTFQISEGIVLFKLSSFLL